MAERHLVPPVCIPEVFQGVCHANHIRKMQVVVVPLVQKKDPSILRFDHQASFSWDWGPAFPSSGIWLPIRSTSHLHCQTFTIYPIRLSITDFPRIKYLKWDYEELTETQLQVSIYCSLLYIKEGTAASDKYVTTQSQKHVILMFLPEVKV